MPVDIGPVPAAKLKQFQEAMGVPFGMDPTPEMYERFQKTFEVDRLRAAYDGEQIVATFGAFSFHLTVPGGTLPTAGTTVVSVTSTHRRRGILRSMMTEHLREVHENGEPLAALWASESSIYGRFGYGPASELAAMKLAKPFARLQQPPEIQGTMHLLEKDAALERLPAIYERAAHRRPGMFARSDRWWQDRALADPEYVRHGATAHRRVLHTRDGEPVGYVLYRTQTDHAEGKAEVRVVELIATDPQSEASLWQYIFGIDLVESINYWNLPVDSPLRWWLEQPRRMERKVVDALWIRPVDVAAALNGRRYSSAGSIVFRMRDELCPWNDGVYHLDVDEAGVGTCRPAHDDAQLELTAFALGSAYLGGHRFADLARAGLVQGTAEALKRADALFAWDSPPWCQEIF